MKRLYWVVLLIFWILTITFVVHIMNIRNSDDDNKYFEFSQNETIFIVSHQEDHFLKIF